MAIRVMFGGTNEDLFRESRFSGWRLGGAIPSLGLST
jgi:hypothetical protein